ncbi:hypothetical protein HNQ02_003764 [Flavobacterium sp. 7E]|uniref:hypothetical protein n=1 Tax=Flavobacterium sp. 7E TaxID=2735898 RepID=UPI00156F8AAF|nr:hypothetical protein [Flavobacterium sp. 7E]NRS90817.1 hypothetical protein [Flavobacterium sp. 7E]
MGLFDFFKKETIEEINLSEKLEKIGYFDLIDNFEKKKYIKEKIDFDFADDSNQYVGKGWLTFPNDYYISSVYSLTENKNGSPTSDFRAFEVWASSLFRGEFLDYLKSAKIVFERNNIKLEYKDEIFDENTKEEIHHKVTVNEKEYIIFSGQISRDNIGQIMKNYLDSFRNILNDIIKRQAKEFKVILVTQAECVMFVLLQQDMLDDFKTIINQTKNKLEE